LIVGSIPSEVAQMRSRERKVINTYRTRKIKILGDTMFAVSARRRSNGKTPNPYIVEYVGDLWTCRCPGFANAEDCLHIGAVHKFLAEGPPTNPTVEMRPSYPQDWIAYKEAKRTTLEVMRTMLPALMKESFRDGWAG
jgi:hypothetical protein